MRLWLACALGGSPTLVERRAAPEVAVALYEGRPQHLDARGLVVEIEARGQRFPAPAVTGGDGRAAHGDARVAV